MNGLRSNGHIVVASLVASAMLSVITAFGLMTPTLTRVPTIGMSLSPTAGVATIGNVFTVSVLVEADAPVNAYTGIVHFNPDVVQVTSIDYNTSIADLWAVAPWYKNGDGTIHFAGGSTRSGGFMGTDSLLTITFMAIAPGQTSLTLREVLVLFHDGLGTQAELTPSIDTLLTVTKDQSVLHPVATAITIRTGTPRTDLSGDGLTSLTDVSIFMLHLGSKNSTSDFNRDGHINLIDASLLLFALQIP